ncbi:Nudix family hydrolase [Rhabdochromatium marinum]|uniref:Nudix family hydrolase n=1 Tax=Rhabdochromatium marinum TaxID=48729 RepID=UPI001F5BDD02|nr:Nudix family hydrolase [Rhabdochromatium marinum]MBK1648520.1 thiamine monophosphate synthase [Rhabdochromatium marinum]
MARIHVVAGVLSDAEGRVLIAQRPTQAHQGGYWEFPGGKREPEESPLAALKRELHEELGIEVVSSRPLIQIEHDYGDRRILLDVHRVLRYQGRPQGCEGQPLAWRAATALQPEDFPPADQPVIRALQLPPLSLITPEGAPDPTNPTQKQASTAFLASLEQALTAGSMMDSTINPTGTSPLVQLRAHHLSDLAFVALAQAVAQACHKHGALLVLNRTPDSIPASLAAEVQGFHLTAAQLHNRTAAPQAQARTGLLGASCHHAADLARAAALKLDYVFLSPVQATRSHPNARPLGWKEFARLTQSAQQPVYALGGLTPQDVPQAWAQGAQGIATIRGLWGLSA